MLFTNTDCLCFAKDPAVVRYRSRYWLYYSLRHEDGRFGIGIAESADMEHWTPCGEIEQDALCETNGIAAPGAIVRMTKFICSIRPMAIGRRMQSAMRGRRMVFTSRRIQRTLCFIRRQPGAVGALLMPMCACSAEKYTCILQRATMPCASRKLAAHGQKSILTLGGMRGICWQNRVCLCQNLHGRAIASKHPQRS